MSSALPWDHTQADDFFAIVRIDPWYHKDKSGAVHNAGVLDSSYKIPARPHSSADDMPISKSRFSLTSS